MQTAIIAGGAGFIGSHLVESLLKDSFKVICVDNLVTGRERNIKEFLNNPNFKFLNHDVVNLLNLKKADFIFHLASPASPNKRHEKSYIKKPIDTLLANSLGTYNLLELARKTNSKFLYASSSEVYGDPSISPQNEEYFGNVNPNGVRSVYDEAKRFGEAMTMAYFRKFDLDTRIIRIFNTYGPKMEDDGRVVVNFILQALGGKPITVYGDGTQTRSICYIDDLVLGLKKAVLTQGAKGQVINLGNPEEMTILSLAKLIKEMTNSKSEITFEELPEDDPKRRNPDISKAKELLDWTPRFDAKEGLKKTIEYLKNFK